MKKCEIHVNNWEELAGQRPKWRNVVYEGVKLFENERIKHASYKRSIRKKEHVVAPKWEDKSTKCDICGRICLSLAGFKSHMRSHDMNSGEMNDTQQDGLKCIKCGLIAKSKAGMKSHLRSHARKEEEGNSRRHTRGRVDN